MNQLIEKVKQWSIERGLDHTEPSKQFLKVVEETGEIAAAIARNDMEELQDAIGDTIVTLIILAQQHEMEVEECLEQAYNVICGRTGRMVNGVFVKSEDL